MIAAKQGIIPLPRLGEEGNDHGFVFKRVKPRSLSRRADHSASEEATTTTTTTTSSTSKNGDNQRLAHNYKGAVFVSPPLSAPATAVARKGVGRPGRPATILQQPQDGQLAGLPQRGDAAAKALLPDGESISPEVARRGSRSAFDSERPVALDFKPMKSIAQKLPHRPKDTPRTTRRLSIVKEMQVPLAKIEATPLIRATKRKGTPLASWAAKHARKSVVPSGVSGAMAVKGKSRPSAGGMRRRRSTFGIRGKRASSIGSGFSVHPHSSVNTSDFYRHVSPELPEPVRLRQLIMWCTRRIDVQTLILGKTPLPIVGQVIEEMQDMLEKGNVYLSWYRRSIDHDSSELQRYIVTQQQQQQQQEKQQPHPLNIKNAERRDRLLKVIEDLKNEESSWRAMLGNVSDKHARTLDRLPNALKRVNLKMPVPTDLSFELVEGGNEEISAEKWRARLPSGISEILDRVDSQLQQRSKDREVEELTRDVEFWIDSIGYRVYQARQQQQGALESIEKAGRELSSALEQRARNAQAEARPQSSGAGMPSDPMNLLRALSRSSASSGQ